MQNNNFFESLENTRPFFKAAFEGFSGTGKSFTSGEVAIGIHKLINSKKPIALFYTERAGKGAMKHFYNSRGVEAVIRESRTLSDLNHAIRICEGGAADVLVIDSISHVWENLITSYMEKTRRKFISFRDWGVLKRDWKEKFSDAFLEAQCHIIFTGRAGYEYAHQDGEGGEKELIKTGVKMKVESETEYEPDLVVLMDKIKDIDGNKQIVKRTATIVKDRTNTIDGKSVINPTFKFFAPAISILLAGEAKKDQFDDLDSEIKDPDSGDDKAKLRTILLEEIKGIFEEMELGQSASAKSFKAEMSFKVFKTRSWSAVETLPISDLETGKSSLQSFLDWFKEYFQGMKSQGLEFNKDHALKELDRILTPQNPADQWLADNDGKTFTPRAQAQSSSPDPFGEFDDLPNLDTDPEPVEYPEPDPVPQQQKQPSTNGQAAQIDLF